MSIRLRQGRISDHCRRSRIRAFARTMSRRIIAVRASFGGFPASISWLYLALTPLQQSLLEYGDTSIGCGGAGAP